MSLFIMRDLVTDSDGVIEMLDTFAPGEYTLVETSSSQGNVANATPIRFVNTSTWAGEPELVELVATNAKCSVSFKKLMKTVMQLLVYCLN